MLCNKCDSQIADESRSCPQCGAPVNDPQKNNPEKPNDDSKSVLNPAGQTNKVHRSKIKRVSLAGTIATLIVLLGISAFVFGPNILEKLCKEEVTITDSIVDETAESESKNPTVMTVGDIEISASEFNYYYMQYLLDLSSYLVSPEKQYLSQPSEDGETITWAKHLSNLALEKVQRFEVLYRVALATDKKKYSITDEEQKKLNDQIEEIRTTAAQKGVPIDDYLKESFGEGANEDFVKRQLEKETIVERFNNDNFEEFKATWTNEKIRAVYDANKDSYDVVNLRAFFTKDSNIANTIPSSFTDESSFLSAFRLSENAGNNTEDDTSYFYKSKSSIESKLFSEVANWAFSDNRSSGDKSVFDIENGYNGYCVVWLKSAQFSPIIIDVRSILIPFKNDPQSQIYATTEEISAAKKKADEIYRTWLSGEKTEIRFSELAKTYSADPDSAENGGLYEDIAVGDWVGPFENWCFDPAKKQGDTGIVKTQGGYHIMYMVNNDTNNYQYFATIREEKTTEDSEEYIKGLLASDKYKLTKNDENIANAEARSLKIINALIALKIQQNHELL